MFIKLYSVVNYTEKRKIHLVKAKKAQMVSWGTDLHFSLTSAVEWDGWSMLHPGSFTLRKETQYPVYNTLAGPEGRS